MVDVLNIFFDDVMSFCFIKELGQSLIKRPKARIETDIKETSRFNVNIDLRYRGKIKSFYSNIVRILKRFRESKVMLHFYFLFYFI